jgi:phosphatidylglycerol---prolipoprotein diacylglyceryl transferase
MLTIVYPHIDPVLVEIGPLSIRWYALAYICGLLLGWRYCVAMARRPPKVLDPVALDDFLVWATLGVVLGGRTGYVLFYNLPIYAEHPLQALEIWKGGMSFHGGALGVILALYLFCRHRGISFLGLGDILVCAVPIGLFFGRLANYNNGELWGRHTDVPWGMIFPNSGDELPRHPSQLYEALLEGLVLFLVLFWLQRFTRVRERPGLLAGVFLIGYGIARIVVEFFREPDEQLQQFSHVTGVTMGQLLSVPLVLVGAWLIRRALLRPALA